jgi:serine/threonine-protein kinase RsbW
MSELTARQQARTRNEVEVRVGADPTRLPVLRTVASTIAMRRDFDLDAIADLKIAVDEACAMLVVRASPDSTLSCRFQDTDDEIRVTASILADRDDWPDTSSFGWHVLTTLTDSLDATVTPAAADPGGFMLRIELVKRNGTVHRS